MEASAVARLAIATSLVAWAEREGTLDAVLDVGPSTAADGDLGLLHRGATEGTRRLRIAVAQGLRER